MAPIIRMVKRTLLAAFMVTLSTITFAEAITITDKKIQVGEQTFRYLFAGSPGNKAIVLLHGWPENADEFRDIMPELAKQYAVYAPDLSGIGGTTAPKQRWDKAALAADIKGFIDKLDLDDPLVVGHDIGGMVAYAFARKYPADLSGVAVLDVPIPGLAPWNDVASSSHAWHFDFHNQKGLTETLVAGRQAEYFRYFIDKVGANTNAISNEKLHLYVEAYGTAEKLRAGFELYRAFKEDVLFFKKHNEVFNVPLLVLGGEFSMAATLPVMQVSFAKQGATNIKVKTISGSGHWLSEEQPTATATAIADFARTSFGQE